MELDNIYLGNCSELIKQLPKGNKYVIVTDPPFNVGYHYNTYSDKMNEDDYYRWLAELVNDLPCVIIHYPESLYRFAFEIKKVPERVVSWVYNSNTPRQHRDIAYFGIKPDFTLMHQPYKNMNDKRIQKRIEQGFEGGALYDWMNINQTKNVSKKGAIVHPCQMPVDVMRRVVGVIPDDYVIVDTFMGSGTTAIACIKEHRHFIGFEMDEQYYQLALNRIQAERQQLTLF